MTQPFFTMVAGPNGSGKTTLTDGLRSEGVGLGHYINAHEIASTLPDTDQADRAGTAQAQALDLVGTNLRNGVSTTFETVMSHRSKIDLLADAKRRGFHVRLLFVSTSNPVINFSRVLSRVAQGGQSVPIDKVYARYRRTMFLLFEAACAADDGVIFDNSVGGTFMRRPERPLHMVGSFENAADAFRWTQKAACVPDWVRDYFLEPSEVLNSPAL